MAKLSTVVYENNPLFIATKGLELLFAKALSIAILFLVFIGLSLFAGLPSRLMSSDEPTTTKTDMQQVVNSIQSVPLGVWLVIGAIVLVLLLVGLFIQIVISGISDYTASQLAKDKTVTLGDALGAVFSHFWGYSWVVVLVNVKIFLWSLLLIVPGFIMAVRYSLAGVSFFDKKLGGNNAIKHSLGLTKGAWLTTFAGHALLPMLTFGALQNLTSPGTTAILYRQYTATNGEKLPAHVVSWLTLIIPIALTVIVIFFVIAVALLLANFSAAPATHG